MAKLILTDEEKKAPSYLDWDNESLGKLVKCTAAKLQDRYGQEATFITTGAHLILGSAIKTNSEILTQTIDGFTISGEDAGDWEIKITRLRKAGASARK